MTSIKFGTIVVLIGLLGLVSGEFRVQKVGASILIRSTVIYNFRQRNIPKKSRTIFVVLNFARTQLLLLPLLNLTVVSETGP